MKFGVEIPTCTAGMMHPVPFATAQDVVDTAVEAFADHYLSHVASLASPGVDEVRWQVPLRPGDSVRLRATIAATRPSRSKPDRGIVHTHAELLNQDNKCRSVSRS